MKKPLIRVVAAVVFNQDGSVLLTSRPQDKIFAGFWEFPGGKIETGESDLEALQRELYEEINLSIHHATTWLTLFTVREDAEILLKFFRIRAHEWSGKCIPKENQNFVWENPQNITVSPVLNNNLPILQALALPEYLSGCLNGIEDFALSDERLHQNPKAAQLIDYSGQSFSLHRQHFWAVVAKKEHFLEVADAQAIIWTGSEEDLMTIAQNGLSCVVYVANPDPTKISWFQSLGVHGFIQWQSSFQAA
ncbi:MAG: NUDIX domain-containing protein [Neisseriaceae bacterium]|nr:NUDIX domain-containing protein [Neisseriaceae bacterium]